MTAIRLKFISRYRDRHGKERIYFRRPGCKLIPLPGRPGSTEFMEVYQAALDGRTIDRKPIQPIGATRTIAGSMSDLIVRYYQSAEFRQLAPQTRATYRNLVEHVRERAGDLMVRGMPREFVRRYVAEKTEAPAAANARLKILRVLMAFAVEIGMRPDDPTTGVRKLRSKSDGHTSWPDTAIDAFLKRWPIGTRQHLALSLLLYTGQRRSDVVRMGQGHVRGNLIEVCQQKTGERLLIPIHPELRRALDACPTDSVAFLATLAGEPFTFAGFGNWFADAVKAAGLSGLSAHGLRKAAARRLAEANCTPHQIAAITGHRTLREVERYTRAANQARLAEQAMAKITGSAEPIV